jgi:sporulation protein YlmC with PRC-barrel domain
LWETIGNEEKRITKKQNKDLLNIRIPLLDTFILLQKSKTRKIRLFIERKKTRKRLLVPFAYFKAVSGDYLIIPAKQFFFPIWLFLAYLCFFSWKTSAQEERREERQ